MVGVTIKSLSIRKVENLGLLLGHFNNFIKVQLSSSKLHIFKVCTVILTWVMKSTLDIYKHDKYS